MKTLAATLLLFCVTLGAGEFPKSLAAFPGKAPQLDGVLSPGEWDDATRFYGVNDWVAQFTPTTDSSDLSLKGWVNWATQSLTP